MKYNYKMTMKSKERPQDIMRCFNKHIFRICFIDGEPYADEWDVIAYFKIRDYSQFLKHVPDDCRKQSHVSIMGIQALSYYYVDIEVDELLDWLGKMQDPNALKVEKKKDEEIDNTATNGSNELISNATVFENSETGNSIKCYEENGTVYLDLESAAKGLGITKKAASGNVVVHWTRLRSYLADMGVVHKCTTGDFIPENIFYRLAMKAKNETAEKFQAWIADEVVPSIRKHGGYIAGQNNMTEPELQQAAQKVTDNIINERDALRLKLFSTDPLEVVEAHKKLLELETAPLKQTIKEQQPKVEFSDAVNSSHDGIMVKDLAHLLTQNGFQIGQNKLFELLRDDGFLCTGSGNRYNTPLQTSINRGIMCVREHGFQDGCGRVHLHFTTLITPKGQRFFLQKYANKVLSDEEISAMMAV